MQGINTRKQNKTNLNFEPHDRHAIFGDGSGSKANMTTESGGRSMVFARKADDYEWLFEISLKEIPP